jgi:hypothetical protein
MGRHARAIVADPPLADPAIVARAVDGLGTLDPRPAGTLYALTGVDEEPALLRRMLMQCYADLAPVDQAFAWHTVKRLYEQLTGRLDAQAAMRLALDFRYLSPLPYEKTRTADDRADLECRAMIG